MATQVKAVARRKQASPPAERNGNRGLLARLRGRLPAMKTTERLIAEFVLGNPDLVITLSIAELSERCSASVGSIIALCKQLGLKGFADFKIALAQDLVEVGLVGNIPAVGDDRSLLGSVIRFHVDSLVDTLRVNDEAVFKKAVDALRAAKRIEFFSIGISFPVSYSAASKFTMIGMPAESRFDSHMQLIAATHLGKGDVAFGISCHGGSRETNTCLEVAKSKGATTICITNVIDSAITEHSDIKLYASPSEIRYSQAPLASRVTQMALIDALFVSVIRQVKTGASKSLQSAEDHIARYR